MPESTGLQTVRICAPTRYSVEVVVGVDYGRYVEFGTTFMGAEPFLRPAVRIGGEALAKELKARLPG